MCSHLPRPLSPVLRLSSPPPPPFFFTVRGSGGGVCRRRPAARRHEIRRQDRHPAPLLWLSGDSGFLLFVLLIGISKGVVLLGLRLRPPVASGRLRSPPIASGRLRSPPVASGRLRSPPVTSSRPRSPSTSAMGLGLVQVVPGGGLGGSWGIVSMHERVLGIK